MLNDDAGRSFTGGIEIMTVVKLDAKTHVDIFSQELIRYFVFLQHVVVDAGTGNYAAREEAEESV